MVLLRLLTVRYKPRKALEFGIASAFLYLFSGCGGSSGGGGNGEPKNKPPVVSAAFNPVSLPEDTSTSVSIAGHFSDPDGDALTYSVNGFANVIAAVAGNQINISAPANYNGADSELHQGFDPWDHDNDGVGDPGVRLYFAPDGTSGWDFSNLPNTPPDDAVTNLRDVMREFLIQYVDFHQADYGNLCTDAPACNPTWATQD